MQRDPRAYLLDIVEIAGQLRQLTRDKTLDDVLARTELQWAIERGFQNIGEALFQLRRVDERLVSRIDEHERIIGLRHILVHSYERVNANVLWNILETKLNLLVEQVTTLLAEE